MAPAKRKLRQQNQQASSASAVESDQLQNIRSYVTDFDKQVENRLLLLKREKEILKNNVESAHRFEFLKIAKSVRDMKWIDFVACEDVEKKVEEEVEFAVPSLPPPKKRGTTVKKQRSSKAATAHKRNTRSSRAAGNMNPMETPAGGAKLPSFTITPKVVVRNQFTTPGTVFRGPNTGEVTYSAKGSPVTLKPLSQTALNSSVFTATFSRNGQTLEMTGSPSELDPNTLPKVVDKEGVDQLTHLHHKLSSILRFNNPGR